MVIHQITWTFNYSFLDKLMEYLFFREDCSYNLAYLQWRKNSNVYILSEIYWWSNSFSHGFINHLENRKERSMTSSIFGEGKNELFSRYGRSRKYGVTRERKRGKKNTFWFLKFLASALWGKEGEKITKRKFKKRKTKTFLSSIHYTNKFTRIRISCNNPGSKR